MQEVVRCAWAKNELNIPYHDTEWGVPVYDDRTHFEFLILEGVQAGLSWDIVLKKRENYRESFDNFEPEKIALYGAQKVAQLLSNPGIIRNKLKIAAAIQNAQCYLKTQEQHGSFDAYIWQFVGGNPKINARKTLQDIPAFTEESDALSKDLKKRGFKFVGTTICYAHMQATGMVNDHVISCFRYKDLSAN